MSFYGFAQAVVRAATRIVTTGVHIRGIENLPEGPALVLSNHQSFIDPLVLQAFCSRPIYAMAKSSEFTVPVVGYLLKHLKAFPVRRFEVDATAVRTVLRLLEAGHLVSIYVEGERSWDGHLQGPRIGTLRLALRAGVPIVPCAVTGSYDVLPRWAHGVRRAPVTITYGPAIRFGTVRDRRERETMLPTAGRQIVGALAELLSEPAPDLRDLDLVAAAGREP